MNPAASAMALARFDLPLCNFSSDRITNAAGAAERSRIKFPGKGAALKLKCVCLAVDDECSSQGYGSTMTSIDAQAQVSACASATSHRCSILQEAESHLDETFTFVFKQESAVTVTVSLKDANVNETIYEVLLSSPMEGLTLHWAVNNWSLASSSWLPSGSVQVTDRAIETPFVETAPGSWEILMKIPELEVPRCLVFVLRDKDGVWHNNNGCFQVPLKCFEMNDLMEQVILPETTFDNWSLFNRFILASELVDAAEDIGATGMSFMYIWLRFSAIKQLTWYRKCNYQSKDIAYVQERLASLMTEKTVRGKDPSVRRFARMILSTLPRGGGDAEHIRMGILNIMRENGIREGHRPGIEDHFLEQWHQKLHTNTSPEDIHICEAYLHFLRTNSMDNFFQTLWDNGQITKEWIESMDHPITGRPVHLPHLIPAFEHFLWILKTVHSGADLDVMVEMSKGYLDDDLKGMLYNVLGNRDAWWIPGELVRTRKQLEKVWKGERVQRDVLLLDIALSNFFGLSIGRIDKSALTGDDLCELISLVLENCSIDAESEELNMCFTYWTKVKAEPRWTQSWALLAMSAIDRISLAVEDHMDSIYNLVQPHAESLGKACGIAETYVSNFGEEVIRGQVLFNISGLLQKLQSVLRGTAGMSAWQVVSHQPSAIGKVVVLPSLASIQGLTYSSPHVVLTEKVDGMEDIPVGVTAVLCSSSVDMLSHVAIRARDSQVLLASCFSGEDFENMKHLSGRRVLVNVGPSGQVLLSESLDSDEAEISENVQAKVPVTVVNRQINKFVLAEDEFEPDNVGGKSMRISMLRKKIDASVLLPPSIALPLGVFEEVMNDAINSGVNAPFSFSLQRLKAATGSEGIPAELARIRELIRTKLTVPKELRRQLISVAESSGLIQAGYWENDNNWEKAWQAICHVWSSKWTDRAWLSRQARGIPDEALYMGCLLQKVIPADYAFVVHTVHPTTKDPGTMFCEVVPGLGEVLVGNCKGNACSFSVSKSNLNLTEMNFLSLPSKRIGLFAEEGTLISRSDSNGEDLEGFSGAGLYDSVTLEPSTEVVLDYTNERLIWDHTFRDQLLQSIAQLGIKVETMFNGQAQDIEGVYSNGVLAIVQTRPQVV